MSLYIFFFAFKYFFLKKNKTNKILIILIYKNFFFGVVALQYIQTTILLSLIIGRWNGTEDASDTVG